ncbi:MAG: hypothetical protein H7259_07355 [Cytophagales bacterium]|nr:hypothetical protein [Cytophaga sp.]
MEGYAQSSLPELRTCLEKVKEDKAYAFSLYNKLKDSPGSYLEQGYVGMVESMLAEHTSNPMKKLSYFNEGKSKLEKAIAALPLDVELRYLRLMLQLNVPSLLGYSGNISSDRAYIVQHIASRKEDLGEIQYANIIETMLRKGECTSVQKIQLQQLQRA